MTTAQIVEKYAASVVSIISMDQTGRVVNVGSGFYINSDGDIATNHSVLRNYSKVVVKNQKGETGTLIKVLYELPHLDLVIASTSHNNAIPLPIEDSVEFKTGDRVVVLGFTTDKNVTFTKGKILGTRMVDERIFIKITAKVSSETNGGPVFNRKGRLIGIATGHLELEKGSYYAIPVEYLGYLIKQYQGIHEI